MEKYYDLIMSLIKSHRKYPGCEDIVEEIVDDVYNHAKVVLNTVTNESVITSYLNKVVSISMVTVPKRLGINTRKGNLEQVKEATEIPIESDFNENNINQKVAVFFSTEEETTADIAEEALSKEQSGDFDNDELFTNNSDTEALLIDENSVVEENPSDVNESELLYDNNVTKNADEVLSYDDEDVTPEIGDINENNNTNYEELLIEDEREDESEIELPEEIKEHEVDKSLVDKMINGITEVHDETESHELTNTYEAINEDETSLISDEDMADFGSIEQENELSPEFSIDLDLDEEHNLEDDFISDDLVDQLGEAADLNDISDASSVDNFYEKFEYDPEPTDIDTSEIFNVIKTLDSKHPEKHIADICKLKYQDSLSIDDIASKLDLSEADVLDALNEIVYVIKD